MRALLKRVAEAIADAIVFPMVVAYRASARLAPARHEELFQGFSQRASKWPGLGGSYLRTAFYHRTLRRCPRTCRIEFGTIFATPHVELGEYVYIGAFGNIGHVTVGNDTLIGSGVTILSGKRQHHYDRLDIPIRLQGGTYEPVEIGADAWIGNGAILMDSVDAQAIVAAGSIVTRRVEARTIVGGNPARVIGRRGPDDAAPAWQRDARAPHEATR